MPKISSVVEKDDLVARDARPKDVGSQKKLFDGIKDEPNNKRSKRWFIKRMFLMIYTRLRQK